MQPLFGEFFFAGFEGTTAVNRHGHAFDQVRATQHDRHLDADYAALAAQGFRAARETIRWPRVARHGNGHYDFDDVGRVLEAASRHGLTLLFDLFHFGTPERLSPFDDAFLGRFTDYCFHAAAWVRAHSDGPWFVTPVNEPSFLAWAAGDAGLFAPHRRGAGPDLKRRLARAAIRGADAVWAACPEAQIVSIDPVCRVVPAAGRRGAEAAARGFNEAVFEAWDMLAGRLAPELGGSPRHLGIVGVNYYWTNQWELDGVAPLPLDDPRRVPLSTLLAAVWARYRAPVLVTETAGYGTWRPAWIREVARESLAAIAAGVPLGGVCLYPVLSMPEWHEPAEWAEMGLWDLVPDDGTLRRVAHGPAMEALDEARRFIARGLAAARRRSG